MRARLTRLGVVAVGLLALVGGLTPPAQATTISSAAFTGNATLAAPLGYPCMGTAPGPGGTTTLGSPDLALCPHNKLLGSGLSPLTLLTQIGSTHVITPQTYPVLNHNRTGVAFTLTNCINFVVNINKPGKAPQHAGPCTAAPNPTPKPGGNTVAGNCGLSTGQVQVVFTDALGQVYDLDLHFIAVGGTLFIEGHSKKRTGTPQQQGLVVGIVEAVPPLPLSIPTFSNGTSCANKTARVFQIVGVIEGVG